MIDMHYLRMRFDALTGRLDSAASSIARKVNWSGWSAGRPTVLCLDRAQFRKDIEELRSRTNLNWVKISATEPKKIQEKWVQERWRRQTYIAYDLETKCAYLKPWLRRFGEKFLEAVNRTHPIAAVMVGNTDYWQDEAIKLGCKSLNIPFLTLGRENYTKKVDADRLLEHFKKAKFNYGGDGVAVLSRETRDVMVGSGSFADGDVWVTGAPRYDRWQDIESVPPMERNYITLLSYADPVYLAQQNFAECVSLFAEEAKKYASTNLKFIIKVKKPSEVEPIKQAFAQIDEYPVEIAWDSHLYELFPRSRIVIGYNTLAAVEALLTDSPVVLPCWGDACRPATETLMHFQDPHDSNVAYFPDSPDRLRELIKQAVAGTLTTKGSVAERRARFTRHIGLPDHGTSSAAVEKFVNHYIFVADQRRIAGEHALLRGTGLVSDFPSVVSNHRRGGI